LIALLVSIEGALYKTKDAYRYESVVRGFDFLGLNHNRKVMFFIQPNHDSPQEGHHAQQPPEA
jgi:hypothetical protein